MTAERFLGAINLDKTSSRAVRPHSSAELLCVDIEHEATFHGGQSLNVLRGDVAAAIPLVQEEPDAKLEVELAPQSLPQARVVRDAREQAREEIIDGKRRVALFRE